MEKNYPGERWESVALDFEFVNETRIEISNFGRVRTFNKVSNGNIIKGSSINGYKIIRFKFFRQREEGNQKKFDKLQAEILTLRRRVKKLKAKLKELDAKDTAYADIQKSIEVNTESWKKKQLSLSKKFQQDFKERTIHYHALFHRLVAEYFIKLPSPAHTVVAHIDYDKLNNRKSNLKWMTPEENYAHQRFSPNVIASRSYQDGRRKEGSKSTKLTVTKVMLLKKLLNENKPMNQLVKQFKVTETQIIRIRKGENWPEVPAAK